MTPLLRSIDDACGDLGVKRTTLYKLIKERRLDARKQGSHRTYITTKSIQCYIAALPGIGGGNAPYGQSEPVEKPRVAAEAPSAQR